MSGRKGEIERLEKLVPEKAARAVRSAYRNALRRGHEVLIVRNGSLVRVLPNDVRIKVKEVASRIPAVKGKKYILVSRPISNG